MPDLIPAFRQMSVNLYVRGRHLDVPGWHTHGTGHVNLYEWKMK
jgi:hypothetical protein